MKKWKRRSIALYSILQGQIESKCRSANDYYNEWKTAPGERERKSAEELLAAVFQDISRLAGQMDKATR